MNGGEPLWTVLMRVEQIAREGNLSIEANRAVGEMDGNEILVDLVGPYFHAEQVAQRLQGDKLLLDAKIMDAAPSNRLEIGTWTLRVEAAEDLMDHDPYRTMSDRPDTPESEPSPEWHVAQQVMSYLTVPPNHLFEKTVCEGIRPKDLCNPAFLEWLLKRLGARCLQPDPEDFMAPVPKRGIEPQAWATYHRMIRYFLDWKQQQG
jgi:hypothetical protein